MAQLPSLKIAFTLDYEIFGDGSGSTLEDQVIPTEYLARVLERHNGKATLFVETGQQIYFNAHGQAHKAQPVEEQMRDLYRRGHDIQLHIHPMWFFAGPPQQDKVTLDTSKYDLSLLDTADMERIIAQSVAYLRDVIAPVDPEYTPTVYRAGAWSIRNTKALFAVLANHGIRMDSTVAPGAHQADNGYGQFDFRDFEMKSHWTWGPLTEVPILTATSKISALYHANTLGMRTRKLVGARYKNRLTQRNRSKLQKLGDIFARDFHMADFNFMSAARLTRMIQQHAERHAGQDSLPVVLIGHSKTNYFTDRIHELLAGLDRLGLSYEVTRLSESAGKAAHSES